MAYNPDKYDPEARAQKYAEKVFDPDTKLEWNMTRMRVLAAAKGVDLSPLNKAFHAVQCSGSTDEMLEALNNLYLMVVHWTTGI